MKLVELSVKVTLNTEKDQVTLSFNIEGHPEIIVEDADRLVIAKESINVLKHYITN